jgi:hypothetical protein
MPSPPPRATPRQLDRDGATTWIALIVAMGASVPICSGAGFPIAR